MLYVEIFRSTASKSEEERRRGAKMEGRREANRRRSFFTAAIWVAR